MSQFRDIPLATDLLSVSQAQLKENFDYLQGSLNKDHQIVFGGQDVTPSEGLHRKVSFLNAGGPVALPAGADSMIFSNAGQDYWINGTVGPIQMTNNSGVLKASDGFTFLPGGLLLQWGSQLASGPSPIFFPTPFTAVYQVVGVTDADDRFLGITGISNASFSFAVNLPAGVTIRWMAIGAK